MAHPSRSVLTALALLTSAAVAQPASDSPLAPPANGPRSHEPGRWAIVGGTVHPRPGETLEGAAVLIEDGRITGVGPAGDLAGWRVFDAEGMHVYAAFIDAAVEVPAPAEAPDAPGRHWNELVTPRRGALDGAGLTEGAAKGLRDLGFGAAGVRPAKGIFRGLGAVVSTAKAHEDASRGRPPVYAESVFHALGFDEGSGVRGYPTSVMGVVSLVRQTLSDADWQRANPAGTHNALTPLEDRATPLMFECQHELGALLADNVCREFGREAVVLGNGMEFRRLEAIGQAGWPVVVPLRFPAKPDVASVGAAEDIALSTLMEWEQAPTNPRRLAEAGLTVAITSTALPKGAKFDANLRRAMDEGGLTPDAALAMLTTNPAEILGVEDQLGTLEAGKRANVLITSKPAFEEKAQRRAIFIDGVLHRLEATDEHGLDGQWLLWVGPEGEPFFTMRFTVKGTSITIEHEAEPGAGADEAAAHADEPDADEAPEHAADEAQPNPADAASDGPRTFKARQVRVSETGVSFIVDDPDEGEGAYILSGVVTGEGRLRGTGIAPDQSAFGWSARRTATAPGADEAAEHAADEATEHGADEAAEHAADEAQPNPADAASDGATSAKKAKKKPEPAPEDLGGSPFGEYAVKEIPEQGTVLLTGATVWTCGPEGVIEDGWVLVQGGKIAAVGGGMRTAPAGATTIDCEGLHITPGLIDCHSHTGLFGFGVNEAGQAVTAECRIHDSLDPGDVNFYRQLAGGLTTVNSLHGSANPIGGQNAVHKIRWGSRHPRDMLLEGARPGIKFALGENVKQSNWGNEYNSRYPQTRMGVETLIRERFQAAKGYMATEGKAAQFLTNIEAAPAYLDRALHHKTGNEIARTKEEFDRNVDLLRREAAAVGYRRDLELETLAEILRGERLVHCHSYRQDEILMLCRVAEDFGFKIGTFQHGLEVYKVAEAVKEHAIGASIFSDWWAYKVEVQDAIPYAGPLQHEAGVLTSFNSDDNELARRLNLEAAKAVKYSDGTITPEEALKFVTINAAVQLAIDARVGSLEAGKDADVVVWSGDPLSTYSRPLRVFVDGRELFSDEIDAAHRQRITAERQRLIQKILAAPERGEDKARDDEAGKADDEAAPPRLLERLYRARQELPSEAGVCGCWYLGGSMGNASMGGGR